MVALIATLSASAAAEASEFSVPLARYATEYDATFEGRAWNITLAARRLDGRVLAPGQELSFNDWVGARGLEDGFRVAPELLNGERVEGIGRQTEPPPIATIRALSRRPSWSG